MTFAQPPRAIRLLLVLVLTSVAACTAGAENSGDPAATPSGSAGPTGEPTPGPPPDAVRIEPPAGGTFLVRGSYPGRPSPCVRYERPRLEARYPGELLVRRDDGTLSLTVTLPFERYLEGIAEVPPTWPRAALEAQAIAARSYALATTGWTGAEGEELDRPICSTAACQVYRGIPVPRDQSVRNWYRAVRRTSGRVLLYQGRPATTVYFSTSNGQTYGNEDVFGSSPLPYLRPVVERHDGASPTSRWRVELPFGHLRTFLGRAGEWPADARISSLRLRGSNVVVSGGGESRTISSGTFRDAVNSWAPCLMPDRYPPASWRGTTLPVTIPSRWMDISKTRGGIVVAGRGWGHGAGMVQWGAYGKALEAWSASDILAFYYGGFRPKRFPEPGLIDVQVASGLTALRIRPSGAGATLEGRTLPAGKITIRGGDALAIDTP